MSAAHRPTVALACLVVLALPPAAPSQPAASDELRAAFLDAYRAAVIGEPGRPDSPAIRNYVLYPYLEAARLEHTLAAIADKEVTVADRESQAFVDAHAGEPVARRVAIARLESFARRDLDRALVEQFDPDLAGASLECRYLAARIRVGPEDGLADAIRARWLTPARLPLDCEPVFEWGRQNGTIDEAAIAERVGRLLDHGETGFARAIARPLSDAARAPLLERAELLEHPAAAFDALIAAPADPPDSATLVDAWGRFARNDPEAAESRVAPLIAALEPEPAVATELDRLLALGLAWDRRSEALDYFAALGPRKLDVDTRTWQIRSALWSGHWPTAADAIAALPDTARAESAWRYWAGRAAAELGDAAGARAAWESTLGDDNFYSALAAARLDQRYRPAHTPVPTPAGDVAALAGIPGFVRARELNAVGLETDARREWNAVYARLGEADRIASIRLAASWNWHEIAVLTATLNGVFYDYDLLYPRDYTEIVPAAADRSTVTPNLLYALIRQESLFAPDAVSPAGAIGLTQLKLETARRAARRFDLDRPSRQALFDPATNVTLGAAELRSLIDEFDGQLLPGLAGYNAGFNAAARWLPDKSIDADIWVENIPYNETRAYVRRVLWHSLVYGWLDSGEPQDASAWLAPVRRP